MNSLYYLYADEASLTILESPDEKVWLVGGDFGYGNFGDIMQHRNTISRHRHLGRYRSVAVMAANAIGDAQFPAFVRQAYGADAVVFVSELPLDLAGAGLVLHPARLVRNAACLHLYGGGFLNERWGPFILGVTEYLLHALHIQTYVVSGQQVTRPFEQAVLHHIEIFRPALFGVRDARSQQWMSEGGYQPEFSFDDAMESLQALSSALPLKRGAGLLMQLNTSDYARNGTGSRELHQELATMSAHQSACDGVTLLHAFADRRMEVVDTRETIKQLERAFPFADYRMIELTQLAYRWPNCPGMAVQGDIGYSCSYHVALWLQLAGIPCWLRGQNTFYGQKAEAVQVQQDLQSFLRDPHLADHRSNLERRLIWQERLDAVLLASPGLQRTCELPSAIDRELVAFQFKGRRLPEQDGTNESPVSQADDWVATPDGSSAGAPESSELCAYALALNAQITELGCAANELRLRAEWAEARLAEAQSQPKPVLDEAVQIPLDAATLRQTVVERDRQLASLNQAIAQKDSHVRELAQELHRTRSEADSLFKHLDRVLHSHSWTITRPLRVAMRFVRHGHLDAAGEQWVFQLARFVGKRLPFPLWMKARVRAALLRWHFPKAGEFQASMQRPAGPDGASYAVSGVAAKANQMRAECCALQPGLVSVVLPVYNQAYLLEESIQSVLAQTYGSFELIVVNDGSTDDVEAVLERYLDHPRVRCYTQANQRLPKALSNGFSFAIGEFWTWTSADNIMEPRMLERMVAKFQSEPDLGMVYADYYAIDDRGVLLEDKTWRAHNRPDLRSAEIRLPRTTKTLNTVQDNFIGPCFMYRGWIGRCLGDYDPQLGIEDYDYWMRINAFFEVRHLGSDELLYRYRVHDNTLSAQAQEHRILEKVERLMHYERKRASFYRTAPVFLADSQGMEWLASRGVAAETIHPLITDGGSPLPVGLRQAELLVLTSESAAQHLATLATLTTPTAIIFSPDDRLHQKLQRLLNRPGCLALVPGRIAADRIHLVAPSCPLIDIQSALSLPAVLAFAKNQLFFHATRTSEELKRELPRRQLKPAGQHVLLQVDSFMQGGMENVVIDLAQSLQDTGFEVTIGILGKSGDAADKARERHLRVESFPNALSEEDYVAWLRLHRVGLVNAHYSIFGAAACQREGIPFVETIHNAYVWFDPETIRKYREAGAHITSYICVSNTAAQYADVVLGLDVSKMRVIPNGIDTRNIDAIHFDSNRSSLRQEWQVGPDAPVFLNVASIMATKAQLPLIRAFARVVEQHPDARLVLLGSVMEKPYQRAIEQAVNDLKLQRQVIFAGYHRDVARYYHAADVFVLPSYWEGWSLSLGEAMANGLSCVITDVGSAYEFEEHDNVRIVAPPFGDITQLNYLNLGKFVYGENSEFERDLAHALIEMANCSRGPINNAMAIRLDRSGAYKKYVTFFHEVVCL